LIVEDNVTNQQIMAAMLAKAGYESDVAMNGVEALKALDQKAFSLILMDCQMPEMDGYETTRRIRQQEQYRNLPIIAVTANAFAGVREKCMECGMNEYLNKPVKLPVLTEAIHLALGRRTSS
jgi:CheY-like chemotaxis protein